MPPRVIAHVDLDAFFAAVEQRDNPSLKGKPVVVGADPKEGRGRGVVSTCSYEARVFGIHSAMPISIAYKKCPHAVFLQGDFKKYNKASEEIFDIFYDFTPHIEPISIDEAFLDITESFHLFGTPTDTAQKLKRRIKEEVGLIASIGIAPVKMVAKIASDYSKPDGLLEIKPDKVLDFLWPLSVDKLWGVGAKTKQALNGMGIRTVKDIALSSPDELENSLGGIGLHLYDLANAVDPRDVEEETEVKSVSHEHTFDEDTSDSDEIYSIILWLSEKVSRRLRRYELKGKTLTLKVRLKGFTTHTHAHTLAKRTNHADVIFNEAKNIFDRYYSSQRTKIRLIGVRLTNFEDPYIKDSLFEDQAENKREDVHKAIDKIKNKFGEDIIHRGS